MAAAPAPEFDSASAVLAAVRESRSIADREETRILMLAVDWAAMHSVDSIAEAATMIDAQYGDTGVPVAGPGAPLVAEFSIAEFATALKLPTEHGRDYVGEAIEIRYRLPRLWALVVAGKLTAWRARRIASATMILSVEAAAYVDRHVARFAHKIGPAALDRLIDAAIARYMPDEAQARAEAAQEGRRFDVDTRQYDLTGTATVYGVLDLADALDLDAAVSNVAGQLKDLGSNAPLDVRRSQAAGQLARNQLALDLSSDDDDSSLVEESASSVGEEAADVSVVEEVAPVSVVEEVAQRPSRNNHHDTDRQVVLYVHLSQAAIQGTDPVGHLENLNTPVLTRQIQSWCGAGANITVKPVIDLNTCDPVDSPVVPERHKEQTKLRDRHCVFPWCTRPAKRCDKDHVVPFDQGGPTCPCNLAPLCRRHHRLKTHGHWTYTVITPGTYWWTSPHGYHYLRDPSGTEDVSRDRHSGHPPDR